MNSERTRRDLTEKLGVDDSLIRTVYYGIDAERFAPPNDERRRRLREQLGLPDRPHVAFVGALGDRRKGFDTLFAAWTSLCRDPAWEANLLVVGRGAELPLWQKRAQDEGIEGRIRFLGFRSDVPDVLAACDALVAPTRYEALRAWCARSALHRASGDSKRERGSRGALSIGARGVVAGRPREHWGARGEFEELATSP